MAGKLATYERKRDFGTTPEPRTAGKRRPRARSPRFVVQEHHARRLHWDFRLERDGVLVSWAVPKGLPMEPGENHLAVHTEDHPLDYYDFEGEIPAGQYGAGRVLLWDQGTYEVEEWLDDKVKVVLHGGRLDGEYVLFRTRDDDWMVRRMSPPPPDWAPLPERMTPMLATPAGGLPRDQEKWAYEFKWDGVRALVFVEGGRARAISRNNLDITGSYPELVELADAVASHQLVLDGELVVFDEHGRTSFTLLQQRMKLTGAKVRAARRDHPVVFLVFDLLHLDGVDLTGRPYSERRQALEDLALDGESWQVPPSFPHDGTAVLQASKDRGYEGIIAKRLDSPYCPGRRVDFWRKIKNVRRQELVIGGWTRGEGRRAGELGSLVVGYYADGELRYAGHVGTGFTDRTLRDLREQLAPLRRADSPFVNAVPKAHAVKSTYVEPQLVAEVEFTEWTKDGKLRHPSYKGLRWDKSAQDVIREP